MWFLVGYALFTTMGTKFHHYSLPLVPPLAMLCGVLLDDYLRARDSAQSPLEGAIAVVGAALTFMVGRDLALDVEGRFSAIRLLHLTSYNYERPWPDNLDFHSELWVITALAAIITLLLVRPGWRKVVVPALAASALGFALWGTTFYLPRIAPHWGQRELFLAYEEEQVREPGPIVAYQMNWKGENFYRGNHIHAFVSSGRRFQDWVDAEKKAGTRVFYFVTEHKRLRGLKAELGQPRTVDELTGKDLNNKFQLVRVRF
jgi:hypothetical protein